MTLEDYKPTRPEDELLVKFMLGRETFTHLDLKTEVDVSEYRRTNLVGRLLNAKLIFEVGRKDNRKVFSAFDRAAAVKLSEKKRKTPLGSMWAAMRSMRTFTPDEVLAVCAADWPELTRQEVQTYCSKITKAEYLKVIQKARPNTRPAKYRLINDSGPLPPRVRVLECVIDGNTDMATYVAGNRV